MRTIKTVKNQSIIGIAMQTCGNVDAIVMLLELNDLQGKMNQLTFVPSDEVDLGYSLFHNVDIIYDEESDYVNDKTLKSLGGEVIADGFVLNYYAELLNIFISEVIVDLGTVVAALNVAYNQTYTALDVNASLLIMPGATKLNIVYAMTRDGNAKSLSFTRAGAATELQPDGTRLIAASGMPRNEYNITDQQTKLLLEPASTNLISDSEPNNVALGTWGNYYGNCKIHDVAGDFNIYKIVESPNLSDQRILQGTGGHTFSSPHSQTISFQAKIAERSRMRLFGQGVIADIDFIAGTSTSADCKLTALADGWWNVEYKVTLSETVFYWIGYILADDGSVVYQGDGNSGLYIRHFQLEASEFATSYIPTYGSTVTRPAEVLTVDGLQAEALMDTDEGTLVYVGDMGTELQIDLNNSSDDTKYQLSSKELYNVVDVTSTNDSDTPFTKKVGWRYKNGESDTFVRDGAVTEGANSTAPAAIDKLVVTPIKPMYLQSLVLHNIAIDNATIIKQTT